jgi:5'(3')-deoxyribonucleotidase
MDLDGVLLNIVQVVLDTVNAERGTSFTLADVRGWGLATIFGEGVTFESFAHEHPDLWRRAVLYLGAREFVRATLELAEKYGVPYVFYSGLIRPEEFVPKHEFVRRELGEDLAAIFKAGFGKKELFVECDVVVDDGTANLRAAENVGAYPVCIARNWNDPAGDTGYDGERYDYEGALKRIEELLR